MKKSVLLAVFCVCTAGACTQQQEDNVTETVIQHSQGRIDKARTDVKTAEETVKNKLNEAEKMISDVSAPML